MGAGSLLDAHTESMGRRRGHTEQAVLFTAELPGKQDQGKWVCESTDTTLISCGLLCFCRPRCKSKSCAPAETPLPGGHGREHLCSTAPHPPLCCLPLADGDGEVWDSAQVPSGAPKGPFRVLKATGWDLKSAEATGSQPGDQSQLF